MKTVLYYFTGSGNSLLAANELAKELGDADVVKISNVLNDGPDMTYDRIGLIFPVYAWGMPRIIQQFAGKFSIKAAGKYIFTVITYASMPGNTIRQLSKALSAKGCKLSAGFGTTMPDCYIPWSEAPSDEKQAKLINNTLLRIPQIAKSISAGESILEYNRSGFNWLLSGPVYKMSINYFPQSDKNFASDSNCISCGLCQRICPVDNIRLVDGKPAWQHNCESCMACIQWCPSKAIQYGKASAKRRRYTNPKINVKQMV